jgi:hypothetical protein
MITDQIINYIKDQLTRGISRDKIRTNLLAAGWEEVDIKQAFSFAEPNSQPAVLKIAPSFAVSDNMEKESSVDKASLTKNDEPYIPILKKDPQPNPVYTNPTINETKPIEPAVQQTVQPTINSINPVRPDPVSQPVNQFQNQPLNQSQPLNQTQNNNQPTNSILVVRKNPADVLKNFGDEGQITKPKTSGVLKSIAIFLAIIVVVGNAFVWLYVFPEIDKTQNQKMAVDVLNKGIDKQVARGEVAPDTGFPVANDISPADALKNPSITFKNATAAYFTKNNSYGNTAILLSSCTEPNTVFVDPAVKNALDQISAISKGFPYCSLSTDDTTKKNRMTGYLVYLPMGEAGYCIDSTGASIVVTKKPIGTSCVSGL